MASTSGSVASVVMGGTRSADGGMGHFSGSGSDGFVSYRGKGPSCRRASETLALRQEGPLLQRQEPAYRKVLCRVQHPVSPGSTRHCTFRTRGGILTLRPI